MGRTPCSEEGLNKGRWSTDEDAKLVNYIRSHGEGHWRNLPIKAGLRRLGKSCRLRWMNYLRPDIKRGNISSDEDDLIIRLHSLLGNRWSLIAKRLPGRTDNEIKNYWNCHLSKRSSSTRSTDDHLKAETQQKMRRHIRQSNETNKVCLPKATRVSSHASGINNSSSNDSFMSRSRATTSIQNSDISAAAGSSSGLSQVSVVFDGQNLASASDISRPIGDNIFEGLYQLEDQLELEFPFDSLFV